MRPLQALGASLESICPAGLEAWSRLEAAVLSRQKRVILAQSRSVPRIWNGGNAPHVQSLATIAWLWNWE
jgi:hypothetical protein